jgi:hypothetical protein
MDAEKLKLVHLVGGTSDNSLSNIKRMTFDAILTLDKKPDKHGNFPYIHISSSEHDRIYIYRCPVMKSKYIVYDIYDVGSISYTKHMDLEEVKQYVRRLSSITYVAITEKRTHFDTMKTLYEQQ